MTLFQTDAGKDTPGESEYRIATVPVWVYGISVGTLVRTDDQDGVIRFVDLVEPSVVGTVRIMIAATVCASELYYSTVGPALAAAGGSVGPASLFDPCIVAVHFKNRGRVEMLRDVLNHFESDGVIETWGLADPDTAIGYEPDSAPIPLTVTEAEPLAHDPPSTDRERLWTFGEM